MPPGKGFYGPKYRESGSKDKRLTPLYLLAAVPLLAVFALVGKCAMGGGGAPEPASAPVSANTDKQVKPTELPKVAPTRDPAKKAAGENEGAASIPSNAEKPNIKEWLIAGGKRFELPLSVHSGVEDYFGSARADGKVHAGVDFSLTGLKNVPVESPCEGIVAEVGNDEALGTHVIVDCGGDFKAVVGWLANFSDSTLAKPILDRLFLMDTTVFSLFKAILKTNRRHSDNGKKKGGIKKNTVLHGSFLMPHFIDFSPAADNDQNIYSKLQLPQGSYLLFDKGYNNYKQYAKFTEQGIYLVTRQKENAVYNIAMECLHDDTTSSNILQETIITQTYKNELNNLQTLKLRRIAWYDEKQNKSYAFITNNFDIELTLT